MGNAYNLVIHLTVILNCIEMLSGMSPKTRDFLANFGKSEEQANHQEMSSGMPPETRNFLANFGMSKEQANHQESSSQFQHLTTSDTIPSLPRCQPSNYSCKRQHSPNRSLPPARRNSPARSPSPTEDPLRARSRSPPAHERFMVPPTTIFCSDRVIYGLDQLQFMRLIPYMNPQRLFELRRYTFPTDHRIKIAVKNKVYVPIPTQEQIVLSTSDGDIFAILESSRFLAGIYTCNTKGRGRLRVKKNIESGMLTLLTPDEVKDTPVGPTRPILMSFKVERVHLNQPDH